MYNQLSGSLVLSVNAEFDVRFIGSLLAGDEAVERRFASHFGRLVEIKLRRHGYRWQEIEDLRQETLLRVLTLLRRDGGLDNPDRLGAFVYLVCRNVMLEYLRTAKRLIPMPEELADRADGVGTAMDRMLAREEAGIARKMLAKLPWRDRELLRRVVLEEGDKDGVCRELGVTREHLRVLVFRARVKLREALDDVRGVRNGGAPGNRKCSEAGANGPR
jgi:RNA polymerase sigma-70 factor (ECF subfamily)